MPIDRAATLRQAEKLQRQGKLEQAIAEYLRLVEDQPRDWNTANLLGDLYVRAGQIEPAVEQFARIAESLRKEGFLSKAAALYKKILKQRPDDDRALVQAGELSAAQGLVADARGFFSSAITGRRTRGDARGALELVVRVGALDKHDVTARLAAAHARQQLDDITGALHELTDLATLLVEAERDDDALAPLTEIVVLDPAGTYAPRELARILVKQGRFSEAGPYLTAETIGEDRDLMLVAAEARLRSGDADAGLEWVDTVLAIEPAAADRVLQLSDALASEHREVSFSLVDRVVSTRISERDWPAAAAALRRFAAVAPHHVPALTRLVDVCVDGSLDDEIFEAQALLADAYLATGAAEQAKYVADDLVTRQPDEPAHRARLRAALAAMGEADPDAALAAWVAGSAEFTLDDLPSNWTSADEDIRAPFDTVPSAAGQFSGESLVDHEPSTGAATAPEHVEARANPHEIDFDLLFGDAMDLTGQHGDGTSLSRDDASGDHEEEDLSDSIDAIPPTVAPAETDLESVFARMREDVAHRSPDDAAEVAFARGSALLEAGAFEQSIEHLRLAMRAASRRYASASLIAQAYEKLGRIAEAVEWLGHAGDAPGISADERFDALYRLVDLLERSGEPASALAVCLELQADAGDYRDLADRVARLSRSQAGG